MLKSICDRNVGKDMNGKQRLKILQIFQAREMNFLI